MKKDFTLPFPIYIVDAFAPAPYSGNPAGVCFLTDPRPDEWMQKVALEMNQAETAFFRPMEDGSFQLRWFTPTTEVDLCGHATLATAHIIWRTDMAEPGEMLKFHTRSGILTAKQAGEWIELDFPRLKPEAVATPDGLEDALGIKTLGCWKAGSDLLVLLENEKAVASVSPKMTYLNELEYRGVVITAKADSGSKHDFHSRFFGPRVGIPEDPATGSSHCGLAPFWGERLGKTAMIGFQASARGGEIRVELPKDQPERVKLQGNAFTMMQGVVADGAPL